MALRRNHIVVYRDVAEEWRWRFVSSNNRIMATSGEGYINRGDCVDSLEEVFNGYITQIPTSIQDDESALGATALVASESLLPVIIEG